MSMHDFFIVFATCLVTMLLCRCLPLFVLKEFSGFCRENLSVVGPA